ncbi:MAG: hypothetical protein P0S95_04555 [Rhabdochlamydiaceae bacterium]|nr:hypothetical protein [Candidatus Amphrikana amoebophyrae]
MALHPTSERQTRGWIANAVEYIQVYCGEKTFLFGNRARLVFTISTDSKSPKSEDVQKMHKIGEFLQKRYKVPCLNVREFQTSSPEGSANINDRLIEELRADKYQNGFILANFVATAGDVDFLCKKLLRQADTLLPIYIKTQDSPKPPLAGRVSLAKRKVPIIDISTKADDTIESINLSIVNKLNHKFESYFTHIQYNRKRNIIRGLAMMALTLIAGLFAGRQFFSKQS